MKTYALCPISNKKINERIARLNAILSVLLLGLFVLTANIFIIVFLFLDFFIRSAELSKYSPLTFVSVHIAGLLKLKPKLVNAGPKLFAARIGVLFNAGILLAVLFGSNTLAITLIAVFGACAFLEGVFAFCVACQIYPFVYGLFYDSKLVS
jgi:hypothetical protein